MLEAEHQNESYSSLPLGGVEGITGINRLRVRNTAPPFEPVMIQTVLEQGELQSICSKSVYYKAISF